MPNLIQVMKKFSKLGFKFGIISNQSVIGRGLTTVENVNRINGFLNEIFLENQINFEFIYICPHVPEDDCECRKPKTFLGKKAIEKFAIETSKSYYVGDQISDMIFARSLKLGAIGVHNPMLNTEKCDFVAQSLGEAYEWLKERQDT